MIFILLKTMNYQVISVFILNFSIVSLQNKKLISVPLFDLHAPEICLISIYPSTCLYISSSLSIHMYVNFKHLNQSLALFFSFSLSPVAGGCNVWDFTKSSLENTPMTTQKTELCSKKFFIDLRKQCSSVSSQDQTNNLKESLESPSYLVLFCNYLFIEV